MINEPKHIQTGQRQRQPPATAVGDEAEQPAAERPHQEGGGEQHGGIELLHHRVAVGKERRREIQREGGVGVEIIPFDEIADRTDEDRLDPAFDVGEIEMIGHRLQGFRVSSVKPDLPAAGQAGCDLSPPYPNSIGNCRGPRTVPSDQVTWPAGSSLKSGIRFSHSSIATVISIRARLEPTQR